MDATLVGKAALDAASQALSERRYADTIALAEKALEAPLDEDFTRALELDPGYAHARYNRALLLAARGELEDAERDHLAIIKRNQDAQQSRDAWAELRRSRRVDFDDETLAAELVRT